MFNARLAGYYLYGKWLFTWSSPVMSLMVSYFVLLSSSYEIHWIRSGTELSQFLRVFLLTLTRTLNCRRRLNSFHHDEQSGHLRQLTRPLELIFVPLSLEGPT